jgi:hypothetical protein
LSAERSCDVDSDPFRFHANQSQRIKVQPVAEIPALKFVNHKCREFHHHVNETPTFPDATEPLPRFVIDLIASPGRLIRESRSFGESDQQYFYFMISFTTFWHQQLILGRFEPRVLSSKDPPFWGETVIVSLSEMD